MRARLTAAAVRWARMLRNQKTLQFCLLLFIPAGVVQAQSVPSFDPSAFDRTADPCVNFFQYACGTWIKNNPIPPDQSRWDRFDVLQDNNREILRGILEKASAPASTRDAVTQKIGDYYYSCMDEKAIEQQGIAPAKPELDRIAALKTKGAIPAELVSMHRQGARPFFVFSSEPDAKNSMMEIAVVDQGGLGLPDRDYYLKNDAEMQKIRSEYVAHLGRMFALAGDTPERAAAEAQAVMKIETELAKGSQDRVARRNPQEVYHKMTVHELFSLCPFLDWQKYFTAMGAPPVESLNVVAPNFFRTIEEVLVTNDLPSVQSYLRAHWLHTMAQMLPKAFVDEQFSFYGKVLSGAQQIRPRWKRCVDYTDSDLGEALGQKFVDVTFGVEGKQRTLKMVNAIEKALGEDIRGLDWMTPATKQQALTKLAAIRNKIGYPDKWRDYSSLRIVRGDAAGNSLRANEFAIERQLKKIGKPTDRSEWEMTPPTVNAYYDSQQNNINFPAGILQPPFYSNKIDDAVNYGGIGAVIGHELTHGFDDEGRHYDANGNLRDWWTAADAKAFEERAECFVKEYSNFIATGDIHVNGKLTLGENTADNGGLRIAFMALMNSLGDKHPARIDGFTPEQRFFIGWGQVWCGSTRPEYAAVLARVDPHAPNEDRVNGVVSNMPAFRQAFGCKLGQPMVRDPGCRVW